MVAAVVEAEPDGLGDTAPPPADGTPPRTIDGGPALVSARPGRRRRVFGTTLLVIATLLSGLILLVLVASFRDDAAINSHRGEAVADVLAIEFNRTAVRFVTPDGVTHVPANGVLYPSGLVPGERVRVEYDTTNPDLVRVAGRSFTLAFLPVGEALAVTWVIAGPLVWLLRRGTTSRRQARRAERAATA